MADFDTNYWGGGAYTPTDYGLSAAYPDWSSSSYSSPDTYSFSYQQPNYYDSYAGYAPSWGSMPGDDFSSPSMGIMPGESYGIPSIMGTMGGMWDSAVDWLGQSSGEGGGTNGSALLGKAVTGGLGALMGLGQSRALEKARKKQREWEEERARNAGKVAAQQRLDYMNGLRQDPNFRAFTVNAPDRAVMANASDEGYGQNGGEHMFFDPSYLSRVTTTPVDAPGFKCGGAVDAMRQHVDHYAMGGLTSVAGGQDDVVDAKLAPGEYVLDAEFVSALGDGSTEAGAKKLDKMREELRRHKRSGGLSKIPPRAKPIKEYLK